jgi:hypothetical protein
MYIRRLMDIYNRFIPENVLVSTGAKKSPVRLGGGERNRQGLKCSTKGGVERKIRV